MATPKLSAREKIEKVFYELIQTHELHEIFVTDIVKKAHINRSTFYANYEDIYDLANAIKKQMFNQFLEIYQEEVKTQSHSYNFLKLFKHIKANQTYYQILLKLNFDFTPLYKNSLVGFEKNKFENDKYLDYHIAFFNAGFTAVIKKWLDHGCLESPEEMNQILGEEYNAIKK